MGLGRAMVHSGFLELDSAASVVCIFMLVCKKKKKTTPGRAGFNFLPLFP